MFNFIIAIWLGAILNIGFYNKVHFLTPYFGVKAGAGQGGGVCP
jgi:lipid A ethanolaminephosphotransferase